MWMQADVLLRCIGTSAIILMKVASETVARIATRRFN